MLKPLLLTALAATIAVGMSYADQNNNKVTIPVQRISASSGVQMYAGYCAPCHGADGRGHGPVASALKTAPADLTLLAKNNHGKYPDSHIVTVLQFGAEMPSHGTAEMPVWGPILGRMNLTNPTDKQIRISNLSRYLETIQVK